MAHVYVKHRPASLSARACHLNARCVLSSSVLLFVVWASIVCVVLYSEIAGEAIRVDATHVPTEHRVQNLHHMPSSVTQRKAPISCYIITLNTSARAVRLSDNLTCHPFVGSRVTDAMFALVSARVQKNLLAGVSSWGADFTNNQSVSIAYNHMQLWRLLAASPVHSDMLILEDDILVNDQALLLYNKIRGSGVLPATNYILKLTNRYRMHWLGGSELRFIHRFWLGKKSFILHKCVCQTRQNFFSSAAYVLDRDAARVLLQHNLPLQTHVDVFLHYIGCRFSNFFLIDHDVQQFSGRVSTHETGAVHRLLANFKEQVKNIVMTTCY